MITLSKVLVTGARGLLAPYLIRDLQRLGCQVFATTRSAGDYDCDLTNAAATRVLVEAVNPDLVINCAALTDVEYCESHATLSELVNAASVRHLVRALKKDAKLMHISTDHVYSGERELNKEDEAAPINVYGKTKLLGECEAMKHEKTVVARVNFFGKSLIKGKRSLSDWALDMLLSGNFIDGFTDNFFSPLSLPSLSSLLVNVAHEDICGIYNIGSRNGMSKAAFLQELANQNGLDVSAIRMTKCASIIGRTRRPEDLRMDVSAIETAIGLSMPSLEEEIIGCCFRGGEKF